MHVGCCRVGHGEVKGQLISIEKEKRDVRTRQQPTKEQGPPPKTNQSTERKRGAEPVCVLGTTGRMKNGEKMQRHLWENTNKRQKKKKNGITRDSDSGPSGKAKGRIKGKSVRAA